MNSMFLNETDTGRMLESVISFVNNIGKLRIHHDDVGEIEINYLLRKYFTNGCLLFRPSNMQFKLPGWDTSLTEIRVFGLESLSEFSLFNATEPNILQNTFE